MEADKSKPQLAGVIGCPIGHSLSPTIHNFWLKKHKINGYYVPIDVSWENFNHVVKTLPKMGFRGVNVTIPYKENALRICDSVSDQAALIGAVNTLTISDDGTIHGDNTDAYGFMQSLIEGKEGWRTDEGPILVVGAGGAARGVVYALVSSGAEDIHIANRTRERAELISGDYGNRVTTHTLDEISQLVPQMGTIINTTSLGMEGKPQLAFPNNLLRPDTTVLDLVYTPLETELLRDAKRRGCVAIDGLGMLLHQASRSFSYWFEFQPVVDEDVRELVLAK